MEWNIYSETLLSTSVSVNDVFRKGVPSLALTFLTAFTSTVEVRRIVWERDVGISGAAFQPNAQRKMSLNPDAINSLP